MRHLPNMVDMKVEDKEPEELIAEKEEVYPWGLRITLTHEELEKLNVDCDDWQVGDMFHLFAMAKITSISKDASEHGERSCVNLQIIALSGEDEDMENEEEDKKEPIYKKMYND